MDLATKVEKMVEDYPLDIKVAVMGCVVNGPGEAKEADLGVAGGIGEGLLIKHGEISKKASRRISCSALKRNWIIGVKNKVGVNRFLRYFPRYS